VAGEHRGREEVGRDLEISIIRQSIPRSALITIARAGFGDMVKAVVDVERGIMAAGGELHADEEAALLQDGSIQTNLWGINLYPEETEDWVEFDSMINVRPGQNNRSRSVEDNALRDRIVALVDKLVPG
jgi:hypothetical protein